MTDKVSVTNNIARYIRKNIENDTWHVGEKIPSENQLCRELGVSRVSVRNALQQFIALGILESAHGKGTFLISKDLSVFAPAAGSLPQSEENLQTMKHILEFRCMIEPDICGKVASAATPELIERLEKLLDTMRDSVGKSRIFVDADMNFHMEICRASGNPVISAVMTDIFRRRADLGHMLNLATGYYGGIYYHGLLLDAFKKHDGKRARAFMYEHLQRGIDDLNADNDSPPDTAENP